MSMYTVSDASRILGLAVPTINKHIRTGNLKATGGGKGRGGYRIDSCELERFKNEYVNKNPRCIPHMTEKKKHIDPHPLYDTAHIIKQILEHNGLTTLDYVKMAAVASWSHQIGIIEGKYPVPREFTKRFSEFFDITPEKLDILIATQQYMDVERRQTAEETLVEVDDIPEEEKAVVFNGQTGKKVGERPVTNLTVVQDVYYITVQTRDSENLEWSEPNLLDDVVTFRFMKHAIQYLLNELPDSDPGYHYMKNPTKRQVSEDNNYILYTIVNETTLKTVQVKFSINRAEVR